MASSIGMMDSAYFVGRNQILTWINNRLHLNLSRIEEAASGAVQCQMMDMTFPGVVPMHKHVEVSRLVKGRPLDNLEFLQWLKRYCDSVNGGIMNENYNPVERRVKVGKDRNHKCSVKSSKSLQTNMINSGSGNTLSPNRTSGTKQFRSNEAAGGVNSSVEIQALSKEMSVAIKKVLYADDPKESALEEAQDYLNQRLNAVEDEAEIEA
uniref:EB1 C-terminal domain-containing protein n=1 Tax=Glycine max TaxID=3847 RepID=A0A0R0FJC8_SOYBN